jgi:hypothetical protein
MSPMPAFIPDDLPEFILFAVAGVDPAALLPGELPDLPTEIPPGHLLGCAVQMTLNCPPELAVAALRKLADQIEREARAALN